MREILFRGKRLEINDWVEGSLIAYPDGDCYIARPSGDPNVLDKFCVDPDTVGQFAGLMDRNGKRIFEGDIIRYEHNGKVHVDVVEFSPPMFSPSNSCRWSMWRDEVIGNIHDNPELLEVTPDE